MRVTIGHIFVFLSSFCIVMGIWQFLWIKIHRKGYEMEKLEDESFTDFLFRYYEDELLWKLRKRFGPKWFYYGKSFIRFTKIKGVILIVVGIAIGVAVFLVSKTEYGIFLDIEL